MKTFWDIRNFREEFIKTNPSPTTQRNDILVTTFADEIILNEKDIIRCLNNKLNMGVTVRTINAYHQYVYFSSKKLSLSCRFSSEIQEIVFDRFGWNHPTKEILQIPGVRDIFKHTSEGIMPYSSKMDGLVVFKKTSHLTLFVHCLRKLSLPKTLLEQA